MRRVAAWLLLTGSLLAQDAGRLDLRPRWTAGETYARSYRFTLELKGKKDKMPVELQYEAACDFVDRILAVENGTPVHVDRTYGKFRTTCLQYRNGSSVDPRSPRNPAHGQTLRFTVDAKNRLRASDPAGDDVYTLRGPWDRVLARKDVRVGRRWTSELMDPVGDIESGSVTCKVLRVETHEGHPAARVEVKLRAKFTLPEGPGTLACDGHLYFATDIGKPLLLELEGKATLDAKHLGKLRGTARIVAKLEPRAERVDPAPRDPADTKAPLRRALLRPRWKEGERSTVEIEIVYAVTDRIDGKVTHITTTTTVVYDETVTRAADDGSLAMKRSFTQHAKRHETRRADRVVDEKTERHRLEGETVTFVSRDGALVPRGRLPQDSRVAGADWDLAMPGRMVKIGESWDIDKQARDALAPLVFFKDRLKLLAIKDGVAVIGVEDDESVVEAKIEFSLRDGKVTRAQFTVPGHSRDGLLGGTWTVRTVRTMR